MMDQLPPFQKQMVHFALFDPNTGECRQWGSCHRDHLALQIEGTELTVKMHDKGDDIANYRLGTAGQLVRKGRNHGEVEAERTKALVAVDAHFAMWLSPGPFAEVHRIKRAQAEAGGGPMIADEDDRLAVLAAAAAADAHMAAMETQRMAIKRRLRAASKVADIKDILAESKVVPA